MKSPFFPIRSFSFFPHWGHFSARSAAIGRKPSSARAWRSGIPALPETILSSARSRSFVNFWSNSESALRQESFPSSTSSSRSSIRAV